MTKKEIIREFLNKPIGNKIIEEAEQIFGCYDKQCEMAQNSKQCIILNKIVNELIKPMQKEINSHHYLSAQFCHEENNHVSDIVENCENEECKEILNLQNKYYEWEMQ